MTTQPLQGLVQPIPQQTGARPKEFVPKGLNDGTQADPSETSGLTSQVTQGKVSAPQW